MEKSLGFASHIDAGVSLIWAAGQLESELTLSPAQAVIDTPKGEVNVRWTRRYGARHLHVTVPFGTATTIRFCGQTHEVGSGFHAFSVPE